MDTKVRDQVNKDLQKLKSLNIQDYNDLLYLQENILKALYASHEEKFVIPTLIFASFLDSPPRVEQVPFLTSFHSPLS